MILRDTRGRTTSAPGFAVPRYLFLVTVPPDRDR
jgi:hypothetical protein